ncbi:TRAP transporter small permease [Agromyces mangrovi Wang et al. 2018]|uniref:TRAP transporter small permease n=1 Tax=Agromyces mangrovi TaxID=1858653 RepID=UPI0025740236|nr:TRAP transporter small permease subunit [Agromyces mangrovi]BDZ65362.1 hypothetical protein GCM10025877_23000 [Agromyces mangrovi]
MTPEDPVVDAAGHRLKPAKPEPRFFRVLGAVEVTLGCTFLVLIFLGVLAQVLGRYVPVLSWPGSGEIARFSLVALTFVCVGYLVGNNGHITIQIIDYVAKGRAFVVVKVVAAAATAAICGLLAYEAYVLIGQNMFRSSTVTRIPVGYFYVIPLLGFTSGMIRAVYRIFIADREDPAPVEAEAEVR